MSPPDGRTPRLPDDAENRAPRARHVARGVARPDDEAVAAGPERAAPEAAGEADGGRPGRAGRGEAALERDPAPAARTGAVAGRPGEPPAADAAEGPVPLDGEGDARGLAERVGDRRADADGDARTAASRAEAPRVQPGPRQEPGRGDVRGGHAHDALAARRAAACAARATRAAGAPPPAGAARRARAPRAAGATAAAPARAAAAVPVPSALAAAAVAVAAAVAAPATGAPVAAAPAAVPRRVRTGVGGARATGQRHERRDEDPRRPHAGTASDRISATKASTTRGSKWWPAERSISATASPTVSPDW